MLATQIGAQNQPGDVSLVLDLMANHAPPPASFALVRGLGEGLQRAGTSLIRATSGADWVFEGAQKFAVDTAASEADRLQAVQVLAAAPYKQSSPTLLSLIDGEQSVAVQIAALNTLGKFSYPEVPHEIVKRWSKFSKRLRAESLSVLLARTDRMGVLLNAIETGAIKMDDLSSTQIKFLRTSRDKYVQELASRVLGTVIVKTRQQVVESYQPALNLKGDAAAGKKIYQERCSSCHRLGGEGFALGPDLVTVKTTGKEKMMANIIDPNLEVAPQYVAFEIETKDGESYLGIIASESATSVIVRQAFGKDTSILRSNIRGMRSQGQSLMPEGLESGLSQQDVANLLEFVSTADAK